MNIHELIEQIAASGMECGRFNFTLEDMNSPLSATAVDCRGEVVSRCDYFGLSTNYKTMFTVDDAISFLFDCDIHLWELMSWDRTLDWDEY